MYLLTGRHQRSSRAVFIVLVRLVGVLCGLRRLLPQQSADQVGDAAIEAFGDDWDNQPAEAGGPGRQPVATVPRRAL
jgi:hypothetical protein